MNTSRNRTHKYALGNFKLVPLLLLTAIAAAGAGAWFGSKSSEPGAGSRRASVESLDNLQAQLRNTLVLPRDFKTIPEFNLLDKNGQVANTELLKGKWSLLFFGFTHCPDVCPMTLSVVAKSIDKIQADYSDLPTPQVVFVSVDPKRDSPELLKNYVEFFDPEFVALTGDVNDMFSLTQPLGIVVAYTADEDNPENYTVDHTAAMLLVDPELRLRGKFNAPHEEETIVEDYQTLMKNLL